MKLLPKRWCEPTEKETEKNHLEIMNCLRTLFRYLRTLCGLNPLQASRILDIDRSNLTKYETNKNDMTVRTLNRIIFRYTHHIIHHQIEIPKEYKDFFDNNGSEENLRAFFLAKLIIQSMNNTNQKTEKQHSSNKTKSKNAAKK